MTQEQHPITPPPELVAQWVSLACEYEGNETWIDLATEAARWGADLELEACCAFLYDNELCDPNFYQDLREHRRPKPPSLKERALEDFDGLMSELDVAGNYSNCAERIRRALEALPDD